MLAINSNAIIVEMVLLNLLALSDNPISPMPANFKKLMEAKSMAIQTRNPI
jgi:hypothetical protein